MKGVRRLNSQMWNIVIQIGLSCSYEVALDKEEMTIGRDRANDIIVSSPIMSRFHAKFIRSKGNWYYEDIGSKNGLYIDGR